jgi:hypothetical protein
MQVSVGSREEAIRALIDPKGLPKKSQTKSLSLSFGILLPIRSNYFLLDQLAKPVKEWPRLSPYSLRATISLKAMAKSLRKACKGDVRPH